MGVDAGSVYSSIRIRLTDLDNDLKGVYARLNQLESNITKTTIPAQKNFKEMFGAVVTGQAALQLAQKGFSLLTGAIQDSIKVSTESQEMISKYDVVFAGMGSASEDAARKFSDSFDLAGATAKEMLGNTGNLLQGMGATREESLKLSLEVNTLAGDLASFTNNQGGSKAASEALTKALLGEKESMKTLGIALLDSDVNVRVAKNGQDQLTGTALKLAKAQATLQLITEQSKNAIGDYARTSDSVANTQKRAAERTKELQIAIGTGLNGAVKLASTLWIGFADELTNVIKRSDGVGKLKGATDDLTKSSELYNSIVKTLSTNNGTLSESEKSVLEARKNLAALDIQASLAKIAKTYDDTQSKIRSLNSEYVKNKTYLNGIISEQAALYKMNPAKFTELVNASVNGNTKALSGYSADLQMAIKLVSSDIIDAEQAAIKSGTSAKKAKGDFDEAINGIAQAVNNGSVSIDLYKNVNAELYEKVLSASEALKKAAKDAKEKSEADDKASASAAALASEEEKKAKSLEDQIKKRTEAEKEYNQTVSKTYATVTDQEQQQKDLKKAAEDYISVLYDLGYANENELGTKGYAAYKQMLSMLKNWGKEVEVVAEKTPQAFDPLISGMQSYKDATAEVTQSVETLTGKQVSESEKAKNTLIEQIKSSKENGQISKEQMDILIAKTEEYYKLVGSQEAFKKMADGITTALNAGINLLSAFSSLSSQLNANMVEEVTTTAEAMATASLDALEEEYDGYEKTLDAEYELYKANKDAEVEANAHALELKQEAEDEALDARYEAASEALEKSQQEELDAIDEKLQAELYAKGLTEAATVDQYAAELEAAIAAGDDEATAEAQDAYDKAVLEKQYADIKTATEAAQKAETVALEEQQEAEETAIEEQRYIDSIALQKQLAAEELAAQVAYDAEKTRLAQEKADKETEIEDAKTKAIAEAEYQANLVSWGFQLASTTAQAAMAVLNAVSSAMTLGPGAIAALPIYTAIATTAGALSIAAVAASKPTLSYATGGIVPGSSYTGDLVQANLNSGERVLTAAQNAAMYDMMTAYMNGGGGTSGTLTIPVQVMMPNGQVLAETVVTAINNGRARLK